MTISSTSRVAGPYTGTGLVTAYAFAFKAFATTDVAVARTDLSGNVTILALTTDYTVSLNADQNAAPGGSVNLTSALATGYTLYVVSSVQALQGYSLQNNGNWYPKDIENALDRITILCQQTGAGTAQSIRVPDPLGVTALPYPAGRTNTIVGFDATGTLSLYPVGTTTTATGDLNLFNYSIKGIANGTVGAPSVRSNSSSTTGIYFPSTGTIALATNGVQAFYADASQNVMMGQATVGLQNNYGFSFAPATGIVTHNHASGAATGSIYENFGYNGAQVGAIVQAGTTGIGVTSGAAIQFSPANALAGQFDSSGNLLLTQTGVGLQTSYGFSFAAVSGIVTVNHPTGAAGGSLYQNFGYNGVQTGAIFQVGTTSIGISAAGALQFSPNNTLAAQLDTSGNFLVAQTANGLQNSNSIYLSPAGTGAQIGISHPSGQASASFYAGFGYNGSVIGSITQSGTTAVLYNTTSDSRLKTAVVPLPDQGSVVDSIQVREFEFKTEPGIKHKGFIAQELVLVAPEAVKVGDTGDEIHDTWGVDAGRLVPILLREIQSLRARVAALESKGA